MKKIFGNVIMVVTLLMAGAAFVSCEKENTPAVYTMTVNACKADNAAKQLGLEGNTLNATWAQGERVTVYNVTRRADIEGYLEAQNTGASTTLSGTLNGTIEVGDVLTLKFLGPNYSSQDGTIATIATTCDYAEANVTVAGISNGNITIRESYADFVNQQAIVKFSLQDIVGNALGTTSLQLKVIDRKYENDYYSASTFTTINVSPASATDELFVAVPGFSSKTILLTATVGSDTYFYVRPDVTFDNSQYFDITVKMTKETLTITSVDGSKTRVTRDANGKYELTYGTTYDVSGVGIGNIDGTSDITLNLADGTRIIGKVYINSGALNLSGDATISNQIWSDYALSNQSSSEYLYITGSGTLTIDGGTNALICLSAGVTLRVKGYDYGLSMYLNSDGSVGLTPTIDDDGYRVYVAPATPPVTVSSMNLGFNFDGDWMQIKMKFNTETEPDFVWNVANESSYDDPYVVYGSIPVPDGATTFTIYDGEYDTELLSDIPVAESVYFTRNSNGGWQVVNE